jgi:hypothetical protein
MGKKQKHISEPAYYVPAPKSAFGSLPKLGAVSKKAALAQARGKKAAARLDPKQTARAKQSSKKKAGGKRQYGGGKKKGGRK